MNLVGTSQETVKQYPFWEKRYSSGNHSGKGRKGLERWWKWKQISKYTDAQDVIDVGCGDLDFWKGRDVEKYTGVDVSQSLVNQNMKKRPNWIFILSGGEVTQNISAQDVFCLEMLYHIMDDENYVLILKNLTKYSKKYIYVVTWTKNPIEQLDLHKGYHYQKYRRFEDYYHIFENAGFELLKFKKMSSIISILNGAGRTHLGLWVFKKNGDV